MKKTIIASLLVVLPHLTFGTAQESEIIIIDGKEHALHSEPLEEYFRMKKNKPDVFSEGIMSSANWRGYIGTWKIIKDRFVLAGIKKEYSNSDKKRDEEGYMYKEIPASKIFPGKDYPIDALWFSGKIRIPQGKMVRYVHMGFGSQYERETIVEVVKGKVIKRVEVKYDPKVDSYRSQSDMQWVALGGNVERNQKEDEWIDGRLLPTAVAGRFVESQETFKTRGIFFCGNTNKLPHLWIPDTPKTKAEYLPLHKIPKAKMPEGSHVEISCNFYPKKDYYELNVTNVRELVAGESMHHSKFPEIWADYQNWLKEEEAQKTEQSPSGDDLKAAPEE